MFCTRTTMFDIRHGALAMTQHSDIHVVPWYKPRPFTFGFNKVLIAD